jgi:hypothetical protein
VAEEHVVRIKISASDTGVGATFAAAAAKLALFREEVKRFNNSTTGFDAQVKKFGTSIGNLASKMAGLPFDGMMKGFQLLGTRIGLIIVGVTALIAVLSNAAIVLGGSVVTAIGQAIPAVGLLAAAFARLGAAVKASMALQQEHQNALANASQIAHDHANALYNIQQAQVAVGDSTRNLTNARREATRQLQDLAFAEQQARAQQEEAVLSLVRARSALRTALQSGDVMAIFQAQDQLKQAQTSRQQADVSATRAADDNRRAQKLGVENAPNVIAAKRQEAAAIHAVAEANYAAAAQTRALTQASRTAFAQLTPTEREFANAFTKLREQFKITFRPLTDAIVAPMTQAVKDLTALFKDPEMRAALQGLANELGKSVTRISNFLFSKQSRDAYILPLIKAATDNLPTVTDILLRLAEALAKVGRAFNDAVGGKGGLLDSLDRRLGQFNRFLDRITQVAGPGSGPDIRSGGEAHGLARTGQTPLQERIQSGLGQLGALGSLIGSVVHLLEALGGLVPGSQQGGQPIDALANAIQKLANVLSDPTTIDHIQKVAGYLKDIVTTLASWSTKLSGVFKALGFSPGEATIVSALTTSVILKVAGPLIGAVIGRLLTGVVPAMRTLTGAIDANTLAVQENTALGGGGGVGGGGGGYGRPGGGGIGGRPRRTPGTPQIPGGGGGEGRVRRFPRMPRLPRGFRALGWVGLGLTAADAASYAVQGDYRSAVDVTPAGLLIEKQSGAQNLAMGALGATLTGATVAGPYGAAIGLGAYAGSQIAQRIHNDITRPTLGDPIFGSPGRYSASFPQVQIANRGGNRYYDTPEAKAKLQQLATEKQVVLVAPNGIVYYPHDVETQRLQREKIVQDALKAAAADQAARAQHARGEQGASVTQQARDQETQRETERGKKVFTALDAAAKQSEDQASRSAQAVGQTAHHAADDSTAVYRAGERDTTTGHQTFLTNLSSVITQGPIGRAWETVWGGLQTTQDTAQQAMSGSFGTWLQGLLTTLQNSGVPSALQNLVTHGGGGGGGAGTAGGGTRFGTDASGHIIGVPTGAFLPGGQDDMSGLPPLVGPPSRQQKIDAAISAATSLDAANWPYAWGGGHNPQALPTRGTRPNAVTGHYEIGYDCSGSVYAVLKGAGITDFSGNSGDMTRQGLPARGDEDIVVWANNNHAFLTLRGRDFTTSVKNFENGPGFTSHTHSGFTARKPRGFSTGGYLSGHFDARDNVPAWLSHGEAILNPSQIDLVGRHRVMSVLKSTGGDFVGGPNYATGGVITSALAGSDFVFSAINQDLRAYADDFRKLRHAAREKGAKGIRDLIGALAQLGDDLTAMSEAIQKASQRAATRAQGAVFSITARRGGGFTVSRAQTQEQLLQTQEKNDEDERRALVAEQNAAKAAIDRTRQRLAHAHGAKRKALQAALNGLINQSKDIQDALDENAAKLGGDVEELETFRKSLIDQQASRDAAAAERLRRLNEVHGKTDQSSVFDALAAGLQKQKDALTKLLADATASGNTELVNQISDQLKDIDVALAENTKNKIQSAVDAINKQASVAQTQNSIDQQLAEMGYKVDAQGNLTRTTSFGQPDIPGERLALSNEMQALQQQRQGLQDQLAAAQAAGDQGLVQDLTTQLKQNALAIAQNTEATRQLTGVNLQQFSSTAWQQFRNAAFSGTGQVIAGAVPGMQSGGDVTKTGLFVLHVGEKVTPPGGSGGDQHFNIVVQQANPDLDEAWLAQRLAWEMKVI